MIDIVISTRRCWIIAVLDAKQSPVPPPPFPMTTASRHACGMSYPPLGHQQPPSQIHIPATRSTVCKNEAEFTAFISRFRRNPMVHNSRRPSAQLLPARVPPRREGSMTRAKAPRGSSPAPIRETRKAQDPWLHYNHGGSPTQTSRRDPCPAAAPPNHTYRQAALSR